jgi:hypothetical protein
MRQLGPPQSKNVLDTCHPEFNPEKLLLSGSQIFRYRNYNTNIGGKEGAKMLPLPFTFMVAAYLPSSSIIPK